MIALSLLLAWASFGAYLHSPGRRRRAAVRAQAALLVRVTAGIRARS